MSEQDTAGEAGGRRLPAKLAAHPSVRAVLAARSSGDRPTPPPVIDAAWLRALCLEAGADDAAAVSLDHPGLTGEREHVLTALPGTRSLVSLMVRMNRASTRSPARSVANQEFTRPTNRSTPRPVRWPGRWRTPGIAHSTRLQDSPRRWSASPAASGSWPTRRSPWPPASA